MYDSIKAAYSFVHVSPTLGIKRVDKSRTSPPPLQLLETAHCSLWELYGTHGLNSYNMWRNSA